MSNDSGQPDPEQHGGVNEQLVAYLDGELDDESSRRVEALLASDPKLRRQLSFSRRSVNSIWVSCRYSGFIPARRKVAATC